MLLYVHAAVVSKLCPRLSSINRLFRMISDVTSPAFNVEGRQWRSSVIEIFYYYFTALWADPTVGRSSASNTIPHNLNKILGRGSIISTIFVSCFTASPSRSYIAVLGRVSVESTDRRACATHQFLDPASSSLSELERYPKFFIYFFKISDNYLLLIPVLSWDVIVETLMEYVDDTHDGNDLRIRSSIGGVSSPLVIIVNVDTNFKISMTRLMEHQISRQLSSEYVLI